MTLVVIIKFLLKDADSKVFFSKKMTTEGQVSATLV